MISKETYDKLQEYKKIGLSILKSSEKVCPNGKRIETETPEKVIGLSQEVEYYTTP